MSISYHTFECGACGTRMTNILLISSLREIALEHAKVCIGYPPALPPASVSSGADTTETGE